VDTTDLAPENNPHVFQVVVTNTDLSPEDPGYQQTLLVGVNVTSPAAVIEADPQTLTINIPAGSTSGSAQLNVINAGPEGSLLNWATFSPTNRATVSGGIAIPGGFMQTVTVQYNASGVAPGTYTDSITIYSTDDDRVADKTISVTITIAGETTPAWGAYESGANGRSSDQWYSISSAEMDIRFWMQPFVLADRFVVSDDFGNVYVDAQFSTEDNDASIPLQQQHPRYVDFTKPAGVTRLRVQVIPNTNTSTGWWYYGRMPGQLWY
jgi:hypothetical protein